MGAGGEYPCGQYHWCITQNPSGLLPAWCAQPPAKCFAGQGWHLWSGPGASPVQMESWQCLVVLLPLGHPFDLRPVTKWFGSPKSTFLLSRKDMLWGMIQVQELPSWSGQSWGFTISPFPGSFLSPPSFSHSITGVSWEYFYNKSSIAEPLTQSLLLEEPDLREQASIWWVFGFFFLVGGAHWLGIEPGPLQWKYGVLTTGVPNKSLDELVFLKGTKPYAESNIRIQSSCKTVTMWLRTCVPK